MQNWLNVFHGGHAAFPLTDIAVKAAIALSISGNSDFGHDCTTDFRLVGTASDQHIRRICEQCQHHGCCRRSRRTWQAKVFKLV